MGFRFRKSFGKGPFRINVSKSGVGYSVGTKGFRYTAKAGGGTRTTASIPGTGISYVMESGSKTTNSRSAASSGINASSPVSELNTGNGGQQYCTHCYKLLEPGTTICPYCNRVQSSTPKPTHKQKKPFYKRWWFIAILSIVLLRACGAIVGAEPAETEPMQEIETIIDVIKSTLDGRFDYYDVNYDGEIICVSITQGGVCSDALQAAAGDSKSLQVWNELVDNTKEYSISVSDLVKSQGFDNVPVLVFVLNDTNKDNVLLSVSAGIVMQDYVADMLSRSETIDATDETEASRPTGGANLEAIFADEAAALNAASSNSESAFILNTNTGVFHDPGCRYVDEIEAGHKKKISGSRKEFINDGYDPCDHCCP